MNARLAKVLGLILTLALVLSGCNLIEVDADMQADEDIAKLDKQFGKVVASYDGGEVTANDVMGEFTNNYSQTYYLYQYYFGYTMTADEVLALAETKDDHMFATYSYGLAVYYEYVTGDKDKAKRILERIAQRDATWGGFAEHAAADRLKVWKD